MCCPIEIPRHFKLPRKFAILCLDCTGDISELNDGDFNVEDRRTSFVHGTMIKTSHNNPKFDYGIERIFSTTLERSFLLPVQARGSGKDVHRKQDFLSTFNKNLVLSFLYSFLSLKFGFASLKGKNLKRVYFNTSNTNQNAVPNQLCCIAIADRYAHHSREEDRRCRA